MGEVEEEGWVGWDRRGEEKRVEEGGDRLGERKEGRVRI